MGRGSRARKAWPAGRGCLASVVLQGKGRAQGKEDQSPSCCHLLPGQLLSGGQQFS